MASTALSGGHVARATLAVYSVQIRRKVRMLRKISIGASSLPQQILSALPADPRQIFNQSLLDAYDHDGSHWYLDKFTANSLVDVVPRSPVRFYSGSEDMER